MARKNKKINIWEVLISITIMGCITIYGYINQNQYIENNYNESNQNIIIDLSDIPEYTSVPYVEINNNIPYFTEEDLTTEPFEKYSELDSLGRCGVALANICKEVVPKEGEERGEIGNIKDLSGWVQKRYDNLIKDKYLYNRCHLIG